jgi:cytosine/adenosine deaminase-related metal-dependent hydrolase
MIYRAEWLLPIADEPVRDGWVAVDDGRITAVGHGSAPDAIDLGRAVILPSLVNAHTHLELSYLRDAVPPAEQFVDWIKPLIAARREYPDPADPRIIEAARHAIGDVRAAGTGVVGDVSNTLVTVPLLREAGVPAQVFYELLGFNVSDPSGRVWEARAKMLEHRGPLDSARGGPGGDVRVALAAHAPYSVSPALFSAIRAEIDGESEHVSSVHLGESTEELEFVRRGTGPWRDVLRDMGAWSEEWKPHGGSPVEYLADLGFLDRRVLVVHGVQFTGDDLARLRGLRITVVSCPRSNRHVGVGSPPLEAFYAMGVSVAFGTDSLASTPDLNVFGELAEARRIAPKVPASHLLESATLCGAQALGFGDEYGTIEPGKRASLIAVTVPERVSDVEEYLVSGVQPDAITWLDESIPNSQLPTPK